MNYTQNEKIKQIDIDTLIIGVDIAKHTHVARAQDYRGVELGKALTFNNSIEGFKKLVNWAKDICIENEKNKVVVGMEPTGHYWFNIGHFLSRENIKLVLVNPMHVKKTKELDDNSPTKNDLKDAKVIAQLVKDGRYSEPVIPEGIYAELRVAMDERDDINRELGSIKNKIHRWIDKYFPEFPTVFKNIEGKASLITLREFPFPKDILKLGEQEIINVWKKDIKRAVGPKRAKKLLKAARTSVGIQTGMHMAKKQLMNLLDRYEMLTNQMEELMMSIEEILFQIPGAQEMLSIPGVGVTTVAGFLSETGDLNNYSHPNQIRKLAGLNLKENSSGKHKGKTTISKRGRHKLRAILFKAVMPMVSKNNEFNELHRYYTTRNNNPLKKKQSLIALCNKLIRILFAIGKKKTMYNSEKLLGDMNFESLNKKVA